MDLDPPGDCRRCNLVLHEEARRDNSLRRGRSEPDSTRNDRRTSNNRHTWLNGSARRSQCLLFQGPERHETLSPTELEQPRRLIPIWNGKGQAAREDTSGRMIWNRELHGTLIG
jgi:hypothetical protein